MTKREPKNDINPEIDLQAATTMKSEVSKLLHVSDMFFSSVPDPNSILQPRRSQLYNINCRPH